MATTWPVAVELPEAALLADYTGIEHDLDFVVDLCSYLEEHPVAPSIEPVGEAFSTALVVRYARCFTTGVRERVSDEIINSLPPEQRKLHDFLFKLRQKHIAHSVNAFEENRLMAFVSNRPEETEVQSISVHHLRLAALSHSMIADLRDWNIISAVF